MGIRRSTDKRKKRNHDPAYLLLFLAARFILPRGLQESAHAGAEGPVLMEIDISMSARDVTLLVYHPPVDNSRPGMTANAGAGEVDPGHGDDDSVSAADSDDSDGDLPEMDELKRQNSTGSVKLAEGELATEEATLLRDRLQLAALAASVVIDVRQGDHNEAFYLD